VVLARQKGIRFQLVPRTLEHKKYKNWEVSAASMTLTAAVYAAICTHLVATGPAFQQQNAYQVVHDTLLGHLLLPRICQQCRQGGAVAGFLAQWPQDREAACINNTLP